MELHQAKQALMTPPFPTSSPSRSIGGRNCACAAATSPARMDVGQLPQKPAGAMLDSPHKASSYKSLVQKGLGLHSPTPEPGYTGGRLGPTSDERIWQNRQLQLHTSGQCFPCIAFALKPAGCFNGDECRHCHLCDAEQAKARRRQLQQAARRHKRRLEITKQGNKQMQRMHTIYL